jgi:hypothetical protein
MEIVYKYSRKRGMNIQKHCTRFGDSNLGMQLDYEGDDGVPIVAFNMYG